MLLDRKGGIGRGPNPLRELTEVLSLIDIPYSKARGGLQPNRTVDAFSCSILLLGHARRNTMPSLARRQQKVSSGRKLDGNRHVKQLLGTVLAIKSTAPALPLFSAVAAWLMHNGPHERPLVHSPATRSPHLSFSSFLLLILFLIVLCSASSTPSFTSFLPFLLQYRLPSRVVPFLLLSSLTSSPLVQSSFIMPRACLPKFLFSCSPSFLMFVCCCARPPNIGPSSS